MSFDWLDALWFRVVAFLVAAPVVIPGLACDGGSPPEPTPTPVASPAASPTAEPGTPPAEGSYAFTQVAKGLKRPVFVTNAGDNSNRLFVIEKPGRIRIIKSGLLLAEPFLDMTKVVEANGNEQGLLGLAFHPDFETNGRFFVAYTAKDDANTVAEYRVASPGSDTADPTPVRVLFSIPDEYSNHNGGMLAFGPDGYLYISTGDGGSGGDPDGNGQNLNALLGKILRVDVGGAAPYAIPASNPFANRSGARPEIWAYGLRNPWRYSFDRSTGDLWIADVGQNKYEEVDFQPAASKGGENYGWRTMEGAHCYRPSNGCSQEGLVLPVFEYTHDEGCSVTGGYVYRGKAIPALTGRYLFADYCGSTLWGTTRSASGEFATSELGTVPEGISSFGEDEAGEVYFTVDDGGAVYRLTPK